MRVGIDLMGSDLPSEKLFEAVVQYSSHLVSSRKLMVFVDEAIARSLSHLYRDLLSSDSGKNIQFVPVTQCVEAQELPTEAIRRKKNSSIAVGIRMLAEKEIDAFVSAGNTGALILSAMLTLKRLPGIDRAALLATLPSEAGPIAVLDVGANVTCKPMHLVQFAVMGSIYQQCTLGLKSPRVGLLNIGVEAQKGTAGVREVYKALENYCEAQRGSEAKMEFVGNIEGREVFQGKIDVLVTDGFTGNVFLKTAEGTSSFILNETRRTFTSKLPDASKQILHDLYRHLDYSEYPGAILCGVDGVVIKIHGNSTPKTLFNGIKGAFQLLERQLIEKIKAQLYHSETFK